MMGKKLLKLQLEEANKYIAKLKREIESNDWKLNLWHSLSDPDLQLISFNTENESQIISTEAGVESVNTGNITMRLNLYKKPQKEK